jgi:trehalose/maltose hydrolase-like predicted phosphorylase
VARTRLFRDGALLAGNVTVTERPGRIGTEFTVNASQGQTVVVEKTVALATSRDRAVSDVGASAVRWLADAGPFDDLLRRHVLAWAQLWARFPVDLRGGDDRILPIIRLHIFHLLQTVGPHSVDLDVGVPARGLHGEAYRGHVFWDELFVLPVLNVRLPEVSRSLLKYRYYRSRPPGGRRPTPVTSAPCTRGNPAATAPSRAPWCT